MRSVQGQFGWGRLDPPFLPVNPTAPRSTKGDDMEFYLTVWECSGCHRIELTRGREPQPCERSAYSVGVDASHWLMYGKFLASRAG